MIDHLALRMKGTLSKCLVVCALAIGPVSPAFASGRLAAAPAFIPVSMMASYQGALGTPNVAIGGSSNSGNWENVSLVEGFSATFTVSATDVTTATVSVAAPSGYDVYLNGVFRCSILLDGFRTTSGTPVPGTVTVPLVITVVRQTSTDSTFLGGAGDGSALGAGSSIQYGVPYYDDAVIDDLWPNFPRLDFNLGVSKNGRPLPPLKVLLFPKIHLQGDAPEVPELPDVFSVWVGNALHIKAPQVTAIYALVGSGPSFTISFAVPQEESNPFLTYTFSVSPPSANVDCTVVKRFAGATSTMQTRALVALGTANAISFSYDDWHETPPVGQTATVQRKVVVDGAYPASNYSIVTVSDGGTPATPASSTRIDYHQSITPVFLEEGVDNYRRWIPREETEGYNSPNTFVTTYYVGENNESIGAKSPMGTAVITKTNDLRQPSFTCRTWLDESPQHVLTWANGAITGASITAGMSARTDYTYAGDWNGINRLPSSSRSTVVTTQGIELLAELSTFYTFDSAAQTNPIYMANGQPYVVGTTYMFQSAGGTGQVPRPSTDGVNLKTIAKRYRERTDPAAPADQFLVGLPYSFEQADGAKISYAYEWGTLQGGGTFVPGAGADLLITTLYGVASGTLGATNFSALPSGATVDTLGLVAFRSRKREEVRRRGFLVRQEEFVHTGGAAFESIAWQTFTYEVDGRLLNRQSSANATATIAWHSQWKDRKSTETDETGLTTVFGYDSMGRLTSASTPALGGSPARRVEYGYDGENRITAHRTGPAGSSIGTTTQFNTGGRIAKRIESGNVVTDYSYSNGDRIVTAIFAGGTSEQAVRTTDHFADGRMRNTTGSAVVAEYHKYDEWDSNHRPMHLVRLADNAFGSTTGRTRRETYDLLGRLAEESGHGFGPSGNTNPIIRRRDYNAKGQLREISVVQKLGTGAELKISADTIFVYDNFGQLIRSGLDLNGNDDLDEDGIDRFTGVASDFFKDVTGSLGAANVWWARTINKTYYSAGKSDHYVANSYVRLGTLPAGMSAQTKALDFFNNYTATTLSFDGSGQRIEIAEGFDGTRTGRTTVGGLLVQERVYSDAAEINAAVTMTSSYGYDVYARLTEVTDPRNIVSRQDYVPGTFRVNQTYGRNAANTGEVTLTTTTYDAAGRVYSVTNVPNGSVVYTTYWPTGAVKARWGSGTNPVHSEYDTFGQQKELWTYRNGNAGTPDKTTWIYDPNTGWLTSKVDASGHAVTYNYSYAGSYRVVDRTWARSPAVTTSWQYRLDTGDLERILYSDSTPDITYGYTRTGRLESVDEFDPVTSTTRSVDLTYNRERIDQEILDASFYNGLVLSHRFQNTPILDRANNLVPGRSDGVMLGYKSAQVPSANLNKEYQASLGYDDFGRLNGVNVLYKAWASPDPVRNQLSLPFGYQYKSNTSLWETLAQGSFNLTRTFDGGRDVLASITAARGGSLAQFSYATNNAGERSSVVQTGVAFNDLGSGSFVKFTYDTIGQLVGAKGYLGTETADISKPLNGRDYGFGHDTAGNRKTASIDTETVDYRDSPNGSGNLGANNLNQPRSRGTLRTHVSGAADGSATVTVAGSTVNRTGQGNYWDITLSGFQTYGEVTVAATMTGSPSESGVVGRLTRPAVENFTYDADGNLTDDGLWHYTWDAENRLVAMTAVTAWGAPAKTLSFSYDYLGRRIRKVANVGGVITIRKYVYNGWNLIAELDGGAHQVVQSYVWGDGLLLQAVHTSPNLTAYHVARDGNDNIAALVNVVTGTIAASYEYGPFGETWRAQAIDTLVAASPFRFASYYTDLETGLIYYGHRYYDPSLGRFINRDPIGEAGGMNLYAFAGNDGVNGGDYLGLQSRGVPESRENDHFVPWWQWPTDIVSDDSVTRTEPDKRWAVLTQISRWSGPRKEFSEPVAETNRVLEASGANNADYATITAGPRLMNDGHSSIYRDDNVEFRSADQFRDYLRHKYSGITLGVAITRSDMIEHLPSMLAADVVAFLISLQDIRNLGSVIGPGGMRIGVARTLGRKGVESLARNEALRQRILAVVRDHLGKNGDLATLLKIDPNAKVGMRGSTVTGIVQGNKPTKGEPWNPDDFDLDIAVVSDELYRVLGGAVIPRPGIREALTRADPELFKGLRPGGKGTSIKIYPSADAPGDIIPLH